jgi:hypothetical protein
MQDPASGQQLKVIDYKRLASGQFDDLPIEIG